MRILIYLSDIFITKFIFYNLTKFNLFEFYFNITRIGVNKNLLEYCVAKRDRSTYISQLKKFPMSCLLTFLL